MVAPEKDCIGKRSLGRPGLLDAERRQLVGLVAADRRTAIPRGAQLVLERNHRPPDPIAGHVTSTCYSPVLERPIALALLSRGRTRYGERLYAMSPLTSACVEVEVTHHVHYDPAGERLRG
jgi:sarcosine oxidase subunit alpha